MYYMYTQDVKRNSFYVDLSSAGGRSWNGKNWYVTFSMDYLYMYCDDVTNEYMYT